MKTAFFRNVYCGSRRRVTAVTGGFPLPMYPSNYLESPPLSISLYFKTQFYDSAPFRRPLRHGPAAESELYQYWR